MSVLSLPISTMNQWISDYGQKHNFLWYVFPQWQTLVHGLGLNFITSIKNKLRLDFWGDGKLELKAQRNESPLPHSLLLAIKKQGKKGNPVRVTNTVLNIYLSWRVPVIEPNNNFSFHLNLYQENLTKVYHEQLLKGTKYATNLFQVILISLLISQSLSELINTCSLWPKFLMFCQHSPEPPVDINSHF